MLSQKVLFGDIIYLNTSNGNNTLTGFSTDVSPSFVLLTDPLRTPFRNCHFQILPANGDSGIAGNDKVFEDFGDLKCKLGSWKGYVEENLGVLKDGRVVFMHTETGHFLTAVQKEDSGEATVELSKTFSEEAIFRISLLEDVENEGDEIFYDQKIGIFSEKVELYLTTGDLQKEKREINPSNSYSRATSDFPKVMARRSPFEFNGNQFNASMNETAGEFKLSRFESNENIRQESSELKNGDYIRIRHSDKWLTFYPNQDKKKETYFERLNDQFQSYNLIHTIFQVVEEQALQSNPITTGKSYILRHYLTGNYVLANSLTGLKVDQDIKKSDGESPYCSFEVETDGKNGATSTTVQERAGLRIKFSGLENEAYLKPTEDIPVKNVQFEINTLYFFGFKLPEEYSYKNQKNLTRTMGEISKPFDAAENFNITIERVSREEMSRVIEVEEFTNELQSLVDLISVPKQPEMDHKSLVIEINKKIKSLVERCQQLLLEKLHKAGKVGDNEEKVSLSQKKPYQIEISERDIQALMREFRIFDLIHMVNFLLIKKLPKNLEEVAPKEGSAEETEAGTEESEKFNLEVFFSLYESFARILTSSLSQNTANRFYNSQYIRIYIHFMSDSCEGVFKKDDAELYLHKMKQITLGLLKILLWDDDLDGLGQLNFYQTMIFNTMKGDKTYQTYYLELLEHISSSKAYNLINSFRDAFITTVMTDAETLKAIFPVFKKKEEGDEIYVEFNRDGPMEVALSELHKEEEPYRYFIAALRVAVALSTSKFITFYHEFIKIYPLNILQAALGTPKVNVELKMLIHLIVLYVYFDYLKLPFNFIPANIQTATDELRQALNQEEKKIVDFCKTCIGEVEQTNLTLNNISEEVHKNINSLNTQDCSQQINLLEHFIASDFNFESAQVMLFYMNASIQNGNITIHFLNKAKEALIKVRRTYQNSEGNELRIIPTLLELFTLVNQKMKNYSTIAIYNQVIKTQNPNAEDYSRKIIAGLKKIHLETFAPFDMISLNEPAISAVSFQYLQEVARYENSIADELDKFVILSTMKDVEMLKETIDIALTLNQNVRKYYVEKEIEGDIILDGQEYVRNIELLEKLLTFIYNPFEHFLFCDEKYPDAAPLEDINDPLARFFRVLRTEKVAYRDLPFLLKPKAVSKLQQRIFAMLSIHDILLKLLNCTITLTVKEKPADAPAEVYQARLILVILIAFVSRNKSNQDLLANSHGFISLYYQQKYIDKSCDTLTLFAEVMRDNDKLLEITKKFIYDITCYTFLGTIKPRSINKDSGAYLCTAVMSMHYLQKADIPLVTYNTFTVAEAKLDDLLKNDFSNLDLLKKIEEKAEQPIIKVDFPACYYNIREMLATLAEIIHATYQQKKKDKLGKLRDHLRSAKFFQGLRKPEFRFEFDLKNLLLKVLNKLNFSKHEIVSDFISLEDFETAKNMLSYLVNELFEFLLFSPKNQHKETTEKMYQDFCGATEKPELEGGEIDKNSLKEVRNTYKKFVGCNLSHVKLVIFMDELPLPVVWEYLYVFKDCWKFVAKLCLTYPDVVLGTDMFEYFLFASEQLVPLCDTLSFRVLPRLKKYLARMEEVKQYEPYKERIREIKELLVERSEALAQEKDLQEAKKTEKTSEYPTEKIILDTIIDHIRTSKSKDGETNIEMFSQTLKSHGSRVNILSELLTVIEYNPMNLDKEVVTFIAKLLDVYLNSVLPPMNSGNEALSQDFYNIQTELSELDGENSLVQGALIARNIESLEQIFKLILSFSSGSNLKVVEKLRGNLKDARKKLFPTTKSDQKDSTYEENVRFILREVQKLAENLNDKEVGKFLDFCIMSSTDVINQTSDEIKQLLSMTSDAQKDILNKKMQSFFQGYANKDKDEVFKELGPLPITIETISTIFKVWPDDTASLKIAKYTMLKAIKEYGLENSIQLHFQQKIQSNGTGFISLKTESILLLDLFISKIKYEILSSDS